MGIYPDMIGDSRFLNDLGGYTRKYGMFFFILFRAYAMKLLLRGVSLESA